MNKYQYDNEYFLAEEANIFFSFLDPEEEEAYARTLKNGK